MMSGYTEVLAKTFAVINPALKSELCDRYRPERSSDSRLTADSDRLRATTRGAERRRCLWTRTRHSPTQHHRTGDAGRGRTEATRGIRQST